MSNYRIVKPLSHLPPLRVFTFNITTPRTIDFITQYQAICVDLELHNHAGGTAGYLINSEHDTMSIRATTGIEAIHNAHIEKIRFTSASDIDCIAILAELSQLRRFNALEIS